MRKKRGSEAAGDMVRSFLVVGAVTLAVLLAGASRELIFPRGDIAARVKVVDGSNEIAAARRLAPHEMLTSSGLSPRWRLTSARFEPNGTAVDLHLGYVTPEEKYAELDESTGDSDPFIEQVLGKGVQPLPPITLGVQHWDQRRTRQRERALVRRVGRATLVVTGNASPAELQTLVRSLR